MSATGGGWVINLDRSEETRQEVRAQPPVFFLDDGEPVYEVWFWHPLLKRWFVMSLAPVLALEAQGVVYFHPNEVPEALRERVEALERVAGFDPEKIRGADQPR